MGRLFGTDGVRGVANKELTAELAFKLGQAGAYVLTGETSHTPKIIVGMDTRISGTMLEAAISAGICSVGAKAIFLGVIPTPAVAYLTRLYGADAGIVISASHNPYEFNGIKFFDSKGYKLPDSVEDKIEKMIFENQKDIPHAVEEKIGTREFSNIAIDDYVDYIKKSVPSNLSGVKVAIDCANGATYQVAPRVFKELGADVHVLADQPNGININKGCGSTHLEKLQDYVKTNKLDIGLGFDGDADRVLAVDENGEIVDGDKIMSIIGLELKRQGELPENTIVATVMSNLGLDVMAKKEGLNLVKTKVGDRYVLEEMKAKGYALGGEQSGHIILLKHNTTGDGTLTGVYLLRILKESGKKLSELAGVMEIFPQVLVNAKVSNEKKKMYLEDTLINKMCSDLEAEFHGEGRVLIRPSGTEPLVRVMIEGKDQAYISTRAKELAKVIEERLA